MRGDGFARPPRQEETSKQRSRLKRCVRRGTSASNGREHFLVGERQKHLSALSPPFVCWLAFSFVRGSMNSVLARNKSEADGIRTVSLFQGRWEAKRACSPHVYQKATIFLSQTQWSLREVCASRVSRPSFVICLFARRSPGKKINYCCFGPRHLKY